MESNIIIKKRKELFPKHLDSSIRDHLKPEQFIGDISENKGIIVDIGDTISITNKICDHRILFIIEFYCTVVKPFVELQLEIEISEIILNNYYGFYYDNKISFCINSESDINLKIGDKVNVVIKKIFFSSDKFNCLCELIN